jgi:hypothetical protein
MTLTMELSMEAISAQGAYKEMRLLWIGLISNLIYCFEMVPLADHSRLHSLFYSPTISSCGCTGSVPQQENLANPAPLDGNPFHLVQIDSSRSKARELNG